MKPRCFRSIPAAALLLLLLPTPSLSGTDCVPCDRAQKELTTREAERRGLFALEEANKAYLSKPKLSESVRSKIHSNLLIIDLKMKTADNFIQGAKKAVSDSCMGCATVSDSG